MRRAVSAPNGARSFDSTKITMRDLAFALTEGSLRPLVLALMASVGAHLILLGMFGLCLKFSHASLPNSDIVEVRLIDLRGGRSKENGGVSVGTSSVPEPAIHAALM